MPLDPKNYIFSIAVLEKAVGDNPSEEVRAEINRYAAVSAAVPGTAGLIVPLVARDRLLEDRNDIGATVERVFEETREELVERAKSVGDAAASRFVERLADHPAKYAEGLVVDVAKQVKPVVAWIRVRIGAMVAAAPPAVVAGGGNPGVDLAAINQTVQNNANQLNQIGQQITDLKTDLDTVKKDVADLKKKGSSGSGTGAGGGTGSGSGTGSA